MTIPSVCEAPWAFLLLYVVQVLFMEYLGFWGLCLMRLHVVFVGDYCMLGMACVSCGGD